MIKTWHRTCHLLVTLYLSCFSDTVPVIFFAYLLHLSRWYYCKNMTPYLSCFSDTVPVIFFAFLLHLSRWYYCKNMTLYLSSFLTIFLPHFLCQRLIAYCHIFLRRLLWIWSGVVPVRLSPCLFYPLSVLFSSSFGLLWPVSDHFSYVSSTVVCFYVLLWWFTEITSFTTAFDES